MVVVLIRNPRKKKKKKKKSNTFISSVWRRYSFAHLYPNHQHRTRAALERRLPFSPSKVHRFGPSKVLSVISKKPVGCMDECSEVILFFLMVHDGVFIKRENGRGGEGKDGR